VAAAPSQVAPRARPTTVTVAGWLLFVAAALQIIAVVVQLSQLGTVADATEQAYQGTGDEDTARFSTILGTTIAVILGALFAIAYVVLAIFNNRGKNPARITTWVIGGIGLCCGTLGVIGSAVSGSLNFQSTDDGPDPAEVQRQVDAALPGWYNPIFLTLGVIGLLGLLAAIILLALPPSNDFFRKPQEVWQPPQAGGFPQAGGYSAPGSSYPPPVAPPSPGIPPASGTTPPGAAPPPPGQTPPGSPPPGGPPA
jgi:uncharacterized membrane protein